MKISNFQIKNEDDHILVVFGQCLFVPPSSTEQQEIKNLLDENKNKKVRFVFDATILAHPDWFLFLLSLDKEMEREVSVRRGDPIHCMGSS